MIPEQQTFSFSPDGSNSKRPGRKERQDRILDAIADFQKQQKKTRRWKGKDRIKR